MHQSLLIITMFPVSRQLYSPRLPSAQSRFCPQQQFSLRQSSSTSAKAQQKPPVLQQPRLLPLKPPVQNRNLKPKHHRPAKGNRDQISALKVFAFQVNARIQQQSQQHVGQAGPILQVVRQMIWWCNHRTLRPGQLSRLLSSRPFNNCVQTLLQHRVQQMLPAVLPSRQ